MIIDRYILRELSLPFLGISSAFVALFVTFTLSRLFAQAGSGLLGPGEVRELALLKSLIALEVLLPIALYVAVIVAIGRMHHDSEIHSFQAGGIGLWRMLRPVLFFSLALALVVAYLSTQLRPWAWTRIYTIKNEAKASSEVERIRAGEFHEYGSDARTVFIDSITEDRNELLGVFIHDQNSDALQVISAPSARFTPYVTADTHELLLRDAHVYRAADGRANLYGRFGTFRITLHAAKTEKPIYKEKAKSTWRLIGTNVPSGKAEFQWRLSTPLSTLLLALAAVPLAESTPRQAKYRRLMIALLLYAVYYNLLGIARNWVEQQTMNTLWWAPICLSLCVLAMYAYPIYILRRRRRASLS